MSQFENKLQSFLDATSLLFFYEVNRIQTTILFWKQPKKSVYNKLLIISLKAIFPKNFWYNLAIFIINPSK